MFREMRRKNQLLSREETIEILEKRTAGVLGVTGDNDYPYTVPLSFAFKGNKIFFHSAKEGHKIDGIKKNNKVTFCVIDQDLVNPGTFTTHYRSVTVFGKARFLIDESEKRAALECLAEKYSPGLTSEAQREIERDWNRVCAIEIEIEHMTGKAAREIVIKETQKSD